MYRDSGRSAAASQFLRRVWCTRKALTNGYVNQGVNGRRSAAPALWAPAFFFSRKGPETRTEVVGATARIDKRDSSDDS